MYLYKSNLSSGEGREARVMEAKPRIVTTSHVFVPMLLPLLKWVKPDLTNWLLYVQSTDYRSWCEWVVRFGHLYLHRPVILFLTKMWGRAFLLGLNVNFVVYNWWSIVEWNTLLPCAWKSESNLHFSYSKAPLSLFTIVILRPPDWWNWMYSEALIVNFCSKLNYRHSPYFTFVIFCG